MQTLVCSLVAANLRLQSSKPCFPLHCTCNGKVKRNATAFIHLISLMHVSYCISSHNFTYIIHIFVYAILIPSVQFSLHLKSKWLKIYSKSLPERTKSVLLIFFSILVLHNCSYLVVFVFRARSPRIDGHMEP